MGLLELVFPRSCCGCGVSGSYLCFECKKSLLPHPELCPACHTSSSGFKTCASCALEGASFLDGLLIGFSYQHLLKKLILKLKFSHKKDISSFLAERGTLLVQLNPYLSSAQTNHRLIVSFVPSHRYRNYFQKGYNQSELLAISLAQQLGIPLFNGFQKTRSTTSQVKLKRSQRMKNLDSAFSFLYQERIPQGATLLLVDDVTTTGATLNELAKTAKLQRPDLQIWGLVLARHMG